MLRTTTLQLWAKHRPRLVQITQTIFPLIRLRIYSTCRQQQRNQLPCWRFKVETSAQLRFGVIKTNRNNKKKHHIALFIITWCWAAGVSVCLVFLSPFQNLCRLDSTVVLWEPLWQLLRWWGRATYSLLCKCGWIRKLSNHLGVWSSRLQPVSQAHGNSFAFLRNKALLRSCP